MHKGRLSQPSQPEPPPNPVNGPFGSPSQPTHTPTEFRLSHELDKVKATHDFSKIVNEILTQIPEGEGNKCTLRIEVQATFPEGKDSQSVRRTIKEIVDGNNVFIMDRVEPS